MRSFDHCEKYTFGLAGDKHKILAGQKHFSIAVLYLTFLLKCDGPVSSEQCCSNTVEGTLHFEGHTIAFFYIHIINKLSWAYH